MSKKTNPSPVPDEKTRTILGLDRKRRFKAYAWLSGIIVLTGGILAVAYLQPHRWYTYTDIVSFEQVARDVKVGFVLWKDAEPVSAGLLPEDIVSEPSISSDGTRMIYAREGKDKSDDLFLRRWDGTAWSSPLPMRALNSNFEETSPSLSGDGKYLYFTSNRPGGPGGYDIWVAKWDGVEYAWPLPLTNRVNTVYDELGPAVSPDNFRIFFSSNRPRERVDETRTRLTPKKIEALKTDHDLYQANLAAKTTPYDLKVERQLSMLYSLREGALRDVGVMGKLGGTDETETAVDKALEFLASTQAEDGRWDLSENGGAPKHDMAATAFALLAFYGRGETHDRECKYREVVSKGINWLVDQQNSSGEFGDLRGVSPKGDMYDHGIAALAVIEAYGVTKGNSGVARETEEAAPETAGETGDAAPEEAPEEDAEATENESKPARDGDWLAKAARAAVRFTEQAQHEEGGWRYQPGQKGDLSVSGWMIMALASAGWSGLAVKEKTLDGARRFLIELSSGKDGGAFGYTTKVGAGGHTPAMNAVGFFCNQLLGLSSSSALAWESSSLVDKKGLDINDLYYAYYGTLATYQHQGPAWRRWLESMKKKFIVAQTENGSWVVPGKHSGQMGPVITTALVALCLEAHYRYTPLYGLGFEPDPSGPKRAADGLLAPGDVPSTPLFRHARRIEILSSDGADDTDPVVTDHGDFLYFASSRPAGQGGSDIYRSRFRKNPNKDPLEDPLIPGEPDNLGPEINSEKDERAPALRMAGFHLMFNSDRTDNPDALYGAMSKRVVRRYDKSKMPDGTWMQDNIELIFGFTGALLALVLGTWFALRKPTAEEPRS